VKPPFGVVVQHRGIGGEEDPERLAVRSGLGMKKAGQVQESARHFLSEELPQISAARAHAMERREAEPPAGGASSEPASTGDPA